MPYIRNHRRYLKIAFGKKLFLLFIQAITGSKITVFFPRLFTVQIELVNSFIPSHSELPIVCQMIFLKFWWRMFLVISEHSILLS